MSIHGEELPDDAHTVDDTPPRQTGPAFLMSPPDFLAAEQANNVWMRDLPAELRRIDRARAAAEFMQVYSFLAARARVFLLPSRPGLQDQTYVANLAAVLPHTPDHRVVVANFRSEPRRGETEAGLAFLRLIGNPCIVSPPFFEGEADLKYLNGNVYIGAHGMRTSEEALRWLEEEFAMEVIPLRVTNEYLYHLDCLVFPVSREEVFLCTRFVEPEILARIERHVGVVDVSPISAIAGITNCVRIGEHILCATHIDDLDEGHPEWAGERAKIDELESICRDRGLTPKYFKLTEFLKSGALLSCMVMHLNHLNH